jgi:hypothetical protein
VAAIDNKLKQVTSTEGSPGCSAAGVSGFDTVGHQQIINRRNKTMKKRILSMLLAMIMVVGIVPFSAIPTIAATKTSYEVSTWGELENVLTWDSGTTPVTITLTADIYEETPNVDPDKDEGDEEYDPIPTVQIVGNKTLDLNGYRI